MCMVRIHHTRYYHVTIMVCFMFYYKNNERPEHSQTVPALCVCVPIYILVGSHRYRLALTGEHKESCILHQLLPAL